MSRPYLLRVELPWSCFGLVVDKHVVVDAAPIAHWCIGKDADWAEHYWTQRGASIMRIGEREPP